MVLQRMSEDGAATGTKGGVSPLVIALPGVPETASAPCTPPKPALLTADDVRSPVPRLLVPESSMIMGQPMQALNSSRVVLVKRRWLREFMTEIQSVKQRPPFRLAQTHGHGGEDPEEVAEVLQEDLDAAMKTLPRHVANRLQQMMGVTSNLQACIGTSLDMDDGFSAARVADMMQKFKSQQEGEGRSRERDPMAPYIKEATALGRDYIIMQFDRMVQAATVIQRYFRMFRARCMENGWPSEMREHGTSSRYLNHLSPTKVARAADDEALEASNAALKDGEAMADRFEKEAESRARQGRLRAPKSGASTSYQLSDRDYRILLLGRSFVEREDSEREQEEMNQLNPMAKARMAMQSVVSFSTMPKPLSPTQPSYARALSKAPSRGIAGFGALVGRHGTSAAALAAGDQLKRTGLFVGGDLDMVAELATAGTAEDMQEAIRKQVQRMAEERIAAEERRKEELALWRERRIAAGLPGDLPPISDEEREHRIAAGLDPHYLTEAEEWERARLVLAGHSPDFLELTAEERLLRVDAGLPEELCLEELRERAQRVLAGKASDPRLLDDEELRIRYETGFAEDLNHAELRDRMRRLAVALSPGLSVEELRERCRRMAEGLPDLDTLPAPEAEEDVMHYRARMEECGFLATMRDRPEWGGKDGGVVWGRGGNLGGRLTGDGPGGKSIRAGLAPWGEDEEGQDYEGEGEAQGAAPHGSPSSEGGAGTAYSGEQGRPGGRNVRRSSTMMASSAGSKAGSGAMRRQLTVREGVAARSSSDGTTQRRSVDGGGGALGRQMTLASGRRSGGGGLEGALSGYGEGYGPNGPGQLAAPFGTTEVRHLGYPGSGAGASVLYNADPAAAYAGRAGDPSRVPFASHVDRFASDPAVAAAMGVAFLGAYGGPRPCDEEAVQGQLVKAAAVPFGCGTQRTGPFQPRPQYGEGSDTDTNRARNRNSDSGTNLSTTTPKRKVPFGSSTSRGLAIAKEPERPVPPSMGRETRNSDSGGAPMKPRKLVPFGGTSSRTFAFPGIPSYGPGPGGDATGPSPAVRARPRRVSNSGPNTPGRNIASGSAAGGGVGNDGTSVPGSLYESPASHYEWSRMGLSDIAEAAEAAAEARAEARGAGAGTVGRRGRANGRRVRLADATPPSASAPGSPRDDQRTGYGHGGSADYSPTQSSSLLREYGNASNDYHSAERRSVLPPNMRATSLGDWEQRVGVKTPGGDSEAGAASNEGTSPVFARLDRNVARALDKTNAIMKKVAEMHVSAASSEHFETAAEHLARSVSTTSNGRNRRKSGEFAPQSRPDSGSAIGDSRAPSRLPSGRLSEVGREARTPGSVRDGPAGPQPLWWTAAQQQATAIGRLPVPTGSTGTTPGRATSLAAGLVGSGGAAAGIVSPLSDGGLSGVTGRPSRRVSCPGGSAPAAPQGTLAGVSGVGVGGGACSGGALASGPPTPTGYGGGSGNGGGLAHGIHPTRVRRGLVLGGPAATVSASGVAPLANQLLSGSAMGGAGVYSPDTTGPRSASCVAGTGVASGASGGHPLLITRASRSAGSPLTLNSGPGGAQAPAGPAAPLVLINRRDLFAPRQPEGSRPQGQFSGGQGAGPGAGAGAGSGSGSGAGAGVSIPWLDQIQIQVHNRGRSKLQDQGQHQVQEVGMERAPSVPSLPSLAWEEGVAGKGQGQPQILGQGQGQGHSHAQGQGQEQGPGQGLMCQPRVPLKHQLLGLYSRMTNTGTGNHAAGLQVKGGPGGTVPSATGSEDGEQVASAGRLSASSTTGSSGMVSAFAVAPSSGGATGHSNSGTGSSSITAFTKAMESLQRYKASTSSTGNGSGGGLGGAAGTGVGPAGAPGTSSTLLAYGSNPVPGGGRPSAGGMGSAGTAPGSVLDSVGGGTGFRSQAESAFGWR